MTKILLANPATREPLNNGKERYYIKAGSRWPWSYIRRTGETCMPPFPFFLAYTAAALRENHFDARVIDGVALNMAHGSFIDKAKRIDPNLIIIETAMHAFKHDAALADRLKKTLPRCRIAFSGPFATVFAEKILSDFSCIDYLLLGEYEFTSVDLAKALQKGDAAPKLSGLAIRDGNEIWASPRRGFIEDINQLPSPAFDLFPSNETPNLGLYGDGINTYKPAVTLHSSRGCPFHCDFCLWNQVMYGNGKYRVFTSTRVVDEMEYVIERFGAREIYFDDDDFCASKTHVLDICSEIKNRGIEIKWSCMGDAMSIDEEMIKAMADSGCMFMKFGVESGDRQILKKIGKPLIPENAVRVSELCRRYGIMTHATFVFGLYGEDLESMKKTLNLANRIKFDYAQASIATPFPGTRFFNKLVRDGAIEAIDFADFDGARSCVFNSNALTSDQVVSFRKRAIRSMIMHKIIDHIWWKNFIGRSITLLSEYGLNHTLLPLKALARL